MFRKIYKNANTLIDTQKPRERIITKLSMPKNAVKTPIFVPVAACICAVVCGVFMYGILKKDNIPPLPAGEMVRTAEIPDGNIKYPQTTEESMESFDKIKNNQTYTQRYFKGTILYEKTADGEYEVWLEKDKKVIRIKASNYADADSTINDILK